MATAGTLSLQEAAEALGVHYMTAYRYVRLGLLDAAKVGGVWQVTAEALDAFRSGDGGAPSSPRHSAPWAERLETRLLAGDARGAWGVVESALTAGTELDELYLEVLSPAMVSIGERWAAGELDVSDEHRASGIARRIIGRLGPRFSRRGRSKGNLILATPAGEHHDLPVAILSDLMRLDGWEVSDLGADLPARSLVHSIERTDGLRAVGLSVTDPGCLEACRESVLAAREAAPSVLIVVGGRAITDDGVAERLGADGAVRSASDLVELLAAAGRGSKGATESA